MSSAAEKTDHHSASPPSRPLHVRILLGLIVGAALGLAANLYFSPVPTEQRATLDADADGVDDRLGNFVANYTDPFGRLFLRLVLMVVVPLVFSALALGVLELGDVRKLGRIGLKTLGLTLVLSLSAVLIGVAMVGMFQPGSSLSDEQRTTLAAPYAGKASDAIAKAKQAKKLRDTLLDIVPENPLQEMVGALDGSSKGNGMLAVMFFSLVFGIALGTLPPERSAPMIGWLQALFDVSMVVIGFAMRLAPYAVACLLFSITARLGLDVLLTLLRFVLTALTGMALHLLVVYPLLLWAVAGKSPAVFFRQVSEAMLTAFGTSSSNATLPTALRVAKENLGVPPQISQFVLTIGATGNQNGTALYEGVVVLFLAQLFGVELSVAQQFSVVLMSVLAGVGTAGVPGGSLPLIVIVLQSVGVPGEGIGIILGVDRILDMCRTVLNVTGDLAIAACVAAGEPAEATA